MHLVANCGTQMLSWTPNASSTPSATTTPSMSNRDYLPRVAYSVASLEFPVLNVNGVHRLRVERSMLGRYLPSRCPMIVVILIQTVLNAYLADRQKVYTPNSSTISWPAPPLPPSYAIRRCSPSGSTLAFVALLCWPSSKVLSCAVETKLAAAAAVVMMTTAPLPRSCRQAPLPP